MVRRELFEKSRVGLHPLQVRYVPEHELHDKVVVGEIGELGVVQRVQQGAGLAVIVRLLGGGIISALQLPPAGVFDGGLTMAYRSMPYSAMSSAASGACTLVMKSRHSCSLRPGRRYPVMVRQRSRGRGGAWLCLVVLPVSDMADDGQLRWVVYRLMLRPSPLPPKMGHVI